MRKTTLLGAGIVLLLVINAVTLAYIFINAEGHAPHRPEPKEIIAEMLHFDEMQREQYDGRIAWHRSNINRIDGRIRQAKQELYGLLDENDTAKKDSLTEVLGDLHKEIEQVHFKHFADIKSICRPEQKVYYEQLMTELPRLFGPQKPPPPQQ